ADLPIAPTAQRQRLLEAQLGVRGVAAVECAGGDIDEETSRGRAQVAALVAGECLADVPHCVTTSPGVELDPREIDQSLGDDGVIAGSPAELGRLLEQRDCADRLSGTSGMAPPLTRPRRLEDDVAAALSQPQRRLPVRVRRPVAG